MTRRRLRPNAVVFLALVALAFALVAAFPADDVDGLAAWQRPLAGLAAAATVALVFVRHSIARGAIAGIVCAAIAARMAGLYTVGLYVNAVKWAALAVAVAGIAATDAEIPLRHKLEYHDR